MRMFLSLVIVALVAAWLWLYLSGSALLVSSDGPTVRDGDGQASFRCTYFQGTGFYTADFWHSESGILGVPFCPRIQRP